MPDEIFENPRLVSVYDAFDGQREDLDHYAFLAKELKAKSILDVGCGTGCLAILLGALGFDVTGLDPARSSIDYARSKPNANKVHWILGDATGDIQEVFDLAVMTGNVAQVFLTDQSWAENLFGIRKVLRPEGHLVFELRRPSQKAWLEWTRQKTTVILDVPKIGKVQSWCELTDVSKELVSFRWTYIFESDGAVITSDSTLRFREQESVEQSLVENGYTITEVREAPDRPGKEFVFIAKARQPKA